MTELRVILPSPNPRLDPGTSRDELREFAIRRSERKQRSHQQSEGHRGIPGACNPLAPFMLNETERAAHALGIVRIRRSAQQRRCAPLLCAR
jgi:hypothetical protein